MKITEMTHIIPENNDKYRRVLFGVMSFIKHQTPTIA